MENETEYKQPLITKGLYLGGLVFSLFSLFRYYVLYPDADRAIAYTICGILLVGLGWCYNHITRLNEENIRQWKYMDEIDKRSLK